MPSIAINSFAAGELAPELRTRVDLAKYSTGLARCRNFIVDYKGGVISRPGTEFVTQLLQGVGRYRLVPFQFSTEQAYVLVLGDQSMWVLMNGGVVLESAKNITGVTKANPGVVTSNAHGFANGDTVFIAGITGMTELNGRMLRVSGATANTFALGTLEDINNFDTSGFSSYISGGTVSRVYTLTTPWLAADLFELKFVQSKDVLTVTHPEYNPRDVTRTGHTSWTITEIDFEANIDAPTNIAIATSGGVGTTEYMYTVTAVSESGEESQPGTSSNVVTESFNVATLANTITWDAVAGAIYYNVYRAPWVTDEAYSADSIFGLIGTTEGVEFKDANITADFSQTPPREEGDVFDGSPPAVATYHQQRKFFAASLNEPDKFWATQPGAINNMNTSLPARPSDAIQAVLVSRFVNAIEWMISMPGGLVVFTRKGVWQISGTGEKAPISATDISANPQGQNGTASIEPIVIGQDIIFVETKGATVRNLVYNVFANIYAGTDMSVLSKHLFSLRTVRDWTFAEEPHKLIYIVLDNGILLTLTYLKEQEVFGWARHDTEGMYKACATIEEDGRDVTYFVVQRRVNGEFIQVVERTMSRLMNNRIDFAWCVDCGLKRALTEPASALIVSASSGSGVIFTATPGIFPVDAVGRIIRAAGGIAEITQRNSSSEVVGTWLKAQTFTLPSGAPILLGAGDWSMVDKTTSFGPFYHLIGETIQVVADGVHYSLVVNSLGFVTLPVASSAMIGGVGFTCQLQTLTLDLEREVVQDRHKRAVSANIKLVETKDIQIGHDFTSMLTMKDSVNGLSYTGTQLFTGAAETILSSLWEKEGQVCIQQAKPFPVQITGIIPEMVLGR